MVSLARVQLDLVLTTLVCLVWELGCHLAVRVCLLEDQGCLVWDPVLRTCPTNKVCQDQIV